MGTWRYTIKAAKPIETVYGWFTDFRNFYVLDQILDVSRWHTEEETELERGLGGKLLWRVKFGNQLFEYAAEITGEPLKKIAWTSVGGQNGGELTFDQIDAGNTKITVLLYYPGTDMISAENGRADRILFYGRFPPPGG